MVGHVLLVATPPTASVEPTIGPVAPIVEPAIGPAIKPVIGPVDPAVEPMIEPTVEVIVVDHDRSAVVVNHNGTVMIVKHQRSAETEREPIRTEFNEASAVGHGNRRPKEQDGGHDH